MAGDNDASGDNGASGENGAESLYVQSGEAFARDTNYIDDRITADGTSAYQVEAGRYRLIAARACPWANRALIVRRLLGLEGATSTRAGWTRC